MNELEIINNWEKLLEKGILNRKELVDFEVENHILLLGTEIIDIFEYLEEYISELLYKNYYNMEGIND